MVKKLFATIYRSTWNQELLNKQGLISAGDGGYLLIIK